MSIDLQSSPKPQTPEPGSPSSIEESKVQDALDRLHAKQYKITGILDHDHRSRIKSDLAKHMLKLVVHGFVCELQSSDESHAEQMADHLN